MGTDSTELTFIRCPSCKSLVPAASPRCRMCGSALEASKKASESEDAGQKKNNFQRARQHTINVNAEERARLEEENAVKPKVVAKAEPVQEPEFDIDGTDLGDPLGAFLEEVAVEAEQKFLNNNDEEDFTEEKDFVSENGTHEEHEEEEPVAFEPPPAIEPQPKVKKTFVQNRDLGATLKSRQPARGGLSFSKPKPVEPEVFHEEVQHEEVQHEEFADSPVYEQEEQVFVQEPVNNPPPVMTAAVKSPAVSEELKGRLIGWMVSYKDPKGTATELREGKFFLSRSSLKGSDLIIDDESISTPHALFGISAAGGVKLQDLMSDRGVFIRKKGNEAYQRMLENIRLEHGDWVRFGDVEFQIAIL